MSSTSSLNAINKIHINSSTKMTLSDRFTAFSAQPKINPRSMRRGVGSPISRAASIANQRLLKQLAQKHTREAALKIKRRSMKARPQPTAAFKRVSNGQPLKRGSVKALRLGPSGRLLKANSISDIATMEADFMGQRTSRRSNSISRISDRVGANRLQGARTPRSAGSRPVWRANQMLNFSREPPPAARMRSRSRSRTRQGALQSPRLSQPGIAGRIARGRSNSRPRLLIRGRSRSRIDRVNRMADVGGVNTVPITSRLGRRPGARELRARSSSRSGSVARRPLRRSVATGRIQKRRNSVKAVTARGNSLANGGVQSRLSRPNRRLPSQRQSTVAVNQRLNRAAVKRGTTARGRARSRSRADNRPLQRNNSAARGGAITNRLRGGANRGRAAVRGNTRRGRSQQRGGAAAGESQRNGNIQQQRRGRSRSRGRGRGSARGGRQLGTDKPDVKKEELDKELDQYMSSTKASDDLFL